MGADNVIAGLNTMWTGEHQPTAIFRVINALGEKTNAYGPQGAAYIEIGLNMTSLVNPKALTFAYRAVGGSKLKPQGTLVSSPNFSVIGRNQQFGQSAWQNFRSNPQEQIRITGRRSTYDRLVLREQLAEELYSKIKSSTNDVAQISENLKIPVFQAQRVKDHLFYNTHQLDHGLGIGRFHPDFKIATAWQRLEAGTHTEADLLIFRHEHFESRFEGVFRTDYRTAHNAAERAGRPSGLQGVDNFELKPGAKKWDY